MSTGATFLHPLQEHTGCSNHRSREGEVEKDPAPQAFVYEFGDSSINFAVRYWHGAPILSMWRARDAVAQAVKRKLDDEGYTIPFPQRTLWFGPGETELAVRDVTPASKRDATSR